MKSAAGVCPAADTNRPPISLNRLPPSGGGKCNQGYQVTLTPLLRLKVLLVQNPLAALRYHTW